MEFQQAKEILWKKLGNYKIMALASSVNDYPMIRSVSCIFYNDRIYFGFTYRPHCVWDSSKNECKTGTLYDPLNAIYYMG